MTIHELAASHLRAGNSLRPKELNGSKEGEGPEEVTAARGPDKVEISDEARLLAAQAEADADGAEGLPAERILKIRRWIDDGFYDLPTTVEEVARRILASGDLGI